VLAEHNGCDALGRAQQFMQRVLPLEERGGPKVETIQVYKVEGLKYHAVVTGLREVILELGEIGPAIRLGRNNFTIKDDFRRR
jgi:hypothetical protein